MRFNFDNLVTMKNVQVGDGNQMVNGVSEKDAEISEESYRKLEAELVHTIDLLAIANSRIEANTIVMEDQETVISIMKAQVKALQSLVPTPISRNMEVVRHSELVNGEWVVSGYYWQADVIRKERGVWAGHTSAIVDYDNHQKWEFIETTPEQRYDMVFKDLPF